jgi:hypothetical protein
MEPAAGSVKPPIVTCACRLAQKKNSNADRRIVRKLNIRKLSHTVNKVSSLRDFALHGRGKNNLAVFIARKLSHTVNKVSSLRDFALHGRGNNNLAVFIVFLFLLFMKIFCFL